MRCEMWCYTRVIPPPSWPIRTQHRFPSHLISVSANHRTQKSLTDLIRTLCSGYQDVWSCKIKSIFEWSLGTPTNICCRINYPVITWGPPAPAQLLSDHPGHIQGNEQRVIIFTRPRAAGQGGNNKHQAVEIEFISPCSELVNCNHHLPR